MQRHGFSMLFWGFLFIMINFRIKGIDLLPDVIGYILFISGFDALSSKSSYFREARKFSIPMVVLSIFSIFKNPIYGSEVHLGLLGTFVLIITIAGIVLNLLIVYNIFMGIKEMAGHMGKLRLCPEAKLRWSQYMFLQLATLLAFIFASIPYLGTVYVIGLTIVSVILSVVIMSFIRRCEKSLNGYY